MLSWDGVRETRASLGAGTHLITDAGLDPQDPRALEVIGKFAAVRPVADPSAEPGDAWGGWLALAGGDEPAQTDPPAIGVRRELQVGSASGTSQVSYVAFSPAGMRYDFAPVPGRIGAVGAIAGSAG